MRRFETMVASRPGSFAFPLYAEICLFDLDIFYHHYSDELGGEIFDILLSLSDFTEFKDMILNYKRSHMSGGDSIFVRGQHVDSAPNSP